MYIDHATESILLVRDAVFVLGSVNCMNNLNASTRDFDSSLPPPDPENAILQQSSCLDPANTLDRLPDDLMENL